MKTGQLYRHIPTGKVGFIITENSTNFYFYRDENYFDFIENKGDYMALDKSVFDMIKSEYRELDEEDQDFVIE